MKKKILSFVLVLTFFAAFKLNVFAQEPNYHFKVWVSREEAPLGTAYVDMLLPISENDECYIDFNESNGEKFGISPESEIVKYNEDGFMSYTFHISDALCQMQPSYNFSPGEFRLTEELKNKLSSYGRFSIRAYWNTQADLDLQNSIEYITEMYKLVNKEVSYPSYVYFVGLVDDDQKCVGANLEYDYAYIAEKYKTAKFAYLDAEGNVLSVTESTTIWKRNLYNLYVHLSGESATTEFDDGMPMWLLPFLVLFFPSLIIVVWVVEKIQKKRSEKKKKQETLNQ